MVDDDVEAEQYIRSVAQDEASKMLMGGGSFPDPMDKDSLLKFMRNVVDEHDNKKMSKTANFREEEVGRPPVPVLVWADLGIYADTEGYDLVSTFLWEKTGGVATVSLGRKAKLLDTLFTVRRELKNIGTPRTTVKKGLFGSTEIHEGENT